MTQELTDRVFAARFSNRLNEREAIVLHLLYEAGGGHFGRQSAISGEDIRAHAERFGVVMNRRSLSDAVAMLIDLWRIPIGTSKAPPAGYFLTVTDEDQEEAAAELVKQGVSMLRRAMVLSPKTKYGRELLGQITAEFKEEERAA